MEDRIINLIARGFQESKIAEIVGCTPSYVSQIKAKDDFDVSLKAALDKIKKSKREAELEENYIKLEEKVLAQIEDNLPFADFRDLTQLMGSLIQKKQKSYPNGSIVSNQTQINNTTVLQIPAAVVPEIVLNKQKEIIAVDGRTLAPMTSVGVRSLFKTIEDRRNAEKLVEAPIDPEMFQTIPEDF